MLGQLGFYAIRSPEKAPLPIQRFTDEAVRLLGVLEKRLGEATYMAGDDYSIADISCYPWSFAATTFSRRCSARRWRPCRISALAEGGRRAAGGEEGDDGAVTNST